MTNRVHRRDRHDRPSRRTARPAGPPERVAPPSKHQLAMMIWLAVFPTLTLLNLGLGGWLHTLPLLPRTFVLATIAVPIVIYGVMPYLHRARRRLLSRRLPEPDPRVVVGPRPTAPG